MVYPCQRSARVPINATVSKLEVLDMISSSFVKIDTKNLLLKFTTTNIVRKIVAEI